VPISDIKDLDLIPWWNESPKEYPPPSQYTLDTLAIPVTTTECERTFSGEKKLVTPERNRLAHEVIECPKA
jgi:hypothetical protein